MAKWTDRELKKLKENPNENFWDDLRIVPGAFQFLGVADPVLSIWTVDSVAYYVYAFAVSDYVNFTTQMPHDWLQGTDIRPHIHWTPRNRGTTESGNTVGWQLDCTIASINKTFSTTVTKTLTGTCSGVNDYHEVSFGTGQAKDVAIDMEDKEASAVLMCKLSRVADTWSSNTPATNLPCVLEIDFHYQRRKPEEGLGTYFEYEHLTEAYQKQYGVDR